MKKMLKIILLGLSGSMDSWALGAAYEAADIKIPWTTKGIVAFISGITSLVAVLLGEGLGRVIDPFYIQMAGGAVLVFIGGRTLWSVITGKKGRNYDTDASKTIEPLEGVVLGGVLASDSFCAGLSLCTMGAAAYAFPFVAGVLTFLFLVLAEKRIRSGRFCDYFAGAVLVAIGFAQMGGL